MDNHIHIDENIGNLEKKREGRKVENEKKIAEWEKKSRFEKIRKIREKRVSEMEVNESDKYGSQPSLRVMRSQLSPRSLHQPGEVQGEQERRPREKNLENLKACKTAGGGSEDEA